MRWSKVVLLFQAIITLIIGLVFLVSFVSLDNISVANIKKGFESTDSFVSGSLSPDVADLKTRFLTAAYILLVVSVIELLIIARLAS